MSSELELQPEVSTRALGKLTSIYFKRIKSHSETEKRGIIQQLMRLIKKGIGLDEMQVALENYIEHCTKKVCQDHPTVEQPKTSTVCTLCKGELEEYVDARLRKNVRSFFTSDNIKQWQRPLVRRTPRRQGNTDMDVFDRFDAAMGKPNE